ncbi:hypothetical protein OUZ56_023145 [Daphnia magna]|uniref:AIG1-type G domain-containing protein n=1 Tax=Daphnia magna TaxID=35525 RepID=A0ABR0AYJ2_9CRUS|nr:hypothetical protein OUZ56_023145 [Daphnia magna]
MTELILRLSALGRNVRVGDFYNYFTDAIFSSKEEVPDQGKEISHTKQTKFSFFYQQPFKSKLQILDIDSHVQRYIEKGSSDSDQPWFLHYLNISPKDGDDKKAQVTAFFRVVRRTEVLKWDAIESQMSDYKLKSGGQVTHLVGKVVYGAEVICSFHRELQEETKESAQRNIYLSAKNYFDQTLVNQSAIEDIPVELDNVSCTIFSSLKGGKPIEKSFRELSQYLKKICSSGEDDHPSKWKPINLFLFYIPEQIKTRIELDRKIDFKSEMEQYRSTWTFIEEESLSISNHSSINRFPLLGKVMSDFQHVQPDFRKKIDKIIENEEYGKCHTEDALEKMRSISNFLNDVIDWLVNRRDEIEEFSRLTSGTELIAMDLEEIKIQMAKKDKKFFKVFVLKLEYKEDPTMNCMQKEIGDETSVAELPVVPIFSYEKGSKLVRSMFAEFVEKAQLSNLHGDTSYYIELSQDSPTIDNGTIRTYDNLRQSPKMINDSSSSPSCTITIEPNPNQQDHVENAGLSFSTESLVQLESSQDEEFTTPSGSLSDSNITIEDESSNATQFPQKAETKPSLQQMSISTTNINPIHPIATSSKCEAITQLAEKFEQVSLNDQKSIGRPSVAENIGKNANISTSLECKSASGKSQDDDKCVVPACSTEPYQKQTSSQHDDKSDATIDNTNDEDDDKIRQSESGSRDQNSEPPALEMPVFGENRRIAEIFVDEKTQYSKLLRSGPPNIYLLNAIKKSNGNDFKWFDICRPGDALQSPDPKKHKIIILMGATGSGKSTLINGMINYILGVQWNDPFRFKCVRDEENVRSQAYSQTSSVTAYTLHHQKGMTIPYSITIIDTPGYGDTGGVEKDKEITAKIHRFLTQQETRIDEIHAVCFVAASGDSRLTATQRYIIDSVLSIFGKDMKENLRLLVTFADNDDPPVVEACKLANFPATPASDGITYSKFNSAVLYCSKLIQENELSFDELFWDMGQENFHKFFTMLAEMDGRNLTSTREVIQRRQQQEQSLKDIECELEGYLLNIEEIEKYRQKLRKYYHNMETKKNFVQEKTEMHLIKVDCDEGIMAYNCQTCKNTCEMHLRSTYFQKRQCKDRSCQCSGSDHEFQSFTWTLVPVKVKTTRNDMKAEFEFNSNQKLKTEELMENCSHDLDIAKVKVISLLEQIGVNAISSLDSTALRSNALNPTEYLSLMRSRILEEQPPGYEIRLQTLTDLQHSWNTSAKLSAEKGQSRDSNVTTQPVKSDKTSRGRGSLLRTSATATVGALESKPGYYGKNGRDATPSRSSQNYHPGSSVGQRTGNEPRGIASNASSTTLMCGTSRGRGSGIGGPSNPKGKAGSAIHGTDTQSQKDSEEEHQSPKMSKRRCSNEDGDCQNLDESADSMTNPSSLLHARTRDGDETNSILNQPGDDAEYHSLDDETKQCDETEKTEKTERIKKFLKNFWTQ